MALCKWIFAYRTYFNGKLDEIFEFIRGSNKYFDKEKPWETRNTDIKKCSNTLYNCVQIIANLSILLNPFLPFSSEKIQKWLCLNNKWQEQYVNESFSIPETKILFDRIDKKIIDEEVEKLKGI